MVLDDKLDPLYGSLVDDGQNLRMPNVKDAYTWKDDYERIEDIVTRHDLIVPAIVIPNYDGIDFAFHYKSDDKRYNIEITTLEGENISQYIKNKFTSLVNMFEPNSEFIVGGKIVISKAAFDKQKKKYKKYELCDKPSDLIRYVLSADCEDETNKSILSNTDIIITEYRIKEGDAWEDYDWLLLQGLVPKDMLPEHYEIVNFDNKEKLMSLYEHFYAINQKCSYDLRGVAIKPTYEYRNNDSLKEIWLDF